MSINSTQLKNALSALNIPVAEQIQYSKVAQSLGIIPKKFLNGKETKQLLKEGSQKYKEFVANEVFKRYNIALEAQKEREAQKKKEEKPVPKQREIVKKERLFLNKKPISALKNKWFKKDRFEYSGNESIEDLYYSIKENIRGYTQVVLYWNTPDNKVINRTIIADSTRTLDRFEEEVGLQENGTAIGSDPIDSNENTINFNIFDLISVVIAQTGKSDDILFESRRIESKEGLCGYLSLFEAGYDSELFGVKRNELKDFTKLVSLIKTNNLPIAIIANGFTLTTPFNDIVVDERLVDISIKEKKREKLYSCAELNDSDISTIILCEPDDGVKPLHYLIYDEVNQHLDYIIGEPRLLKGVYLSMSCKVIKGGKFIFTPKQMNVNNKKATNTEITYIFFDYETVIDFNSSSAMQSYSVSVLTLNDAELQRLEELDLAGRSKENASEIELIDIENARLEIAELRKDRCKTFLGYNCGRQFIEWFLRFSYNRVCVFVGFNNTNFDNFLALEDFLSYSDSCNEEVRISDVFYNGSQLLNFKINGTHSFFDIRKHLVGSLKNNCKSFKIESCAKKDCDHAEMQRLHQEGKLIEYINTDEKLKEYNEYDVLATAVLYKRYSNALFAVEATKPYAKGIHSIKTIGSLIYKVFEDNKKKLGFNLPKLDYKTYNDLQKSKIAGRVEMFNGVQKVNEKLVSTDVCSLYPYVMSVLNCYYPCGKEIKEVEKYQGDDTIGFYYCDIDQSNLAKNNLPNIYARKLEVENDWGYTGVLENYLISNVMIGLLRKYNCSVVVKKGFIFTEKRKSCEMFGFLLDLMEEKNKQDTLSREKDCAYNPALRETLKLLMNSLSGKVIEGLHTEKTVTVDTISEYLKIVDKAQSVNFINEVGGKLFLTYEVSPESICKTQQRPIYLGVLIYDYAKRVMFENSYSKIGKAGLLYTDTDASKFRYSDFIKWKEWIDTNNIIVPHWEEVEKKDPRYKTHKIYESGSKVFGSFEDELEDCVGEDYLFYCLEKKSWLYAYKKDGKWKSKYRFKGLNGSAQLLSLEEPFIGKREINHNDGRVEEKHYIKPESELEVYNYYESHKENNIESGNEIKFFEQVYSSGIAYIINSSFRKIVKNSARNVAVENTGSYNNLLNKIQVQYNLKKINIYKK